MTDNVLNPNLLKPVQMSVGMKPYSIMTIALSSGLVSDLEQILIAKIDRSAKAYQFLPVIIDVSDMPYLEELDYEALSYKCAEHGLYLLGLSGIATEDRRRVICSKKIPIVNSNKYAKIEKDNDLSRIITQTFEVKVPVKVSEPYPVEIPVEVKVNTPTLIIQRNIRSGEVISAANNSVAIFGSVSNGARILASHNIFVFGNVNGAELYAGTPKSQEDPGLTNALIYVKGTFDPSLVAIAGNYQTTEDIDKHITLNDNQSKAFDIIVSLKGTSLIYNKADEFTNNNSLRNIEKNDS